MSKAQIMQFIGMVEGSEHAVHASAYSLGWQKRVYGLSAPCVAVGAHIHASFICARRPEHSLPLRSSHVVSPSLVTHAGMGGCSGVSSLVCSHPRPGTPLALWKMAHTHTSSDILRTFTSDARLSRRLFGYTSTACTQTLDYIRRQAV